MVAAIDTKSPMIGPEMETTIPMEWSPIVSSKMEPPAAPKQSKRKKRKVSFNSRVEVEYCITRQEYTEEETKRSWLTFEELRSSKKSNRMLAMYFSRKDAGDTSKDGKDCLRGLEGRTQQGLQKRKQIKRSARRAVLVEQSFQMEIGVVDADALADAYYEHTQYPAVQAHMVALRDETDAALWIETKDMPDSLNNSLNNSSLNSPQTPTLDRGNLFTCAPRIIADRACVGAHKIDSQVITTTPRSRLANLTNIASLASRRPLASTPSKRLLTSKFFKI